MQTMVLLFGTVLILVLLNIPIAVALGVVSTAAMLLTQGPEVLPNLPIVLYQSATNFPYWPFHSLSSPVRS